MADETSYDALTYSTWGRQNNLSGAHCTGTGPAGHVLLGATHGSFRCQVEVGEAPAGVVVAKVLGPESLRVTSVSGGALKPDRGIGTVPKGTPTMQNFDAVIALQKAAWAKAHHVARVLCYGVGSYRPTSTSSYFFAFSCATFDGTGARGAQVLVTAAGKSAVRVVRTLAA
ncbi:MAG TPA: hypothetical protein VFA24_03920 [Gaiellaceae bacterium]|nr:hypothetical protein [Gaiellaceae bacterium]